jgi:hypothetical protein
MRCCYHQGESRCREKAGFGIYCTKHESQPEEVPKGGISEVLFAINLAAAVVILMLMVMR